jgi:hypothetical protein
MFRAPRSSDLTATGQLVVPGVVELGNVSAAGRLPSLSSAQPIKPSMRIGRQGQRATQHVRDAV